MNLEERLKKAGLDFFRTAQIYDNYLLNEVNVYLPWDTELHDYDITNARFATLYGLSCEYYLKGILLPALTVTNPENDPRLQQIINDLSDEDKYRIIIGDDKIEKELSRKYNIRLHDIKKLYGESIKYIGHNLQALSNKILEKAENGKFEPERKNEVLKKLFRNNIFDFIFQNQVISYSFVKGRYAFLDGTKIDVSALEGALAIIRDIVLYSTKGFNIILWDKDIKNNDIEILDRKRIFESEPQKIYVFKENDISRVYLWDGETLIPEYGVEEQIGEEISLYGTAKSYLDNSSPEELRKVLIYIRDENGIKEASIDNPNYWVNELKDKKPLSDGYNYNNIILANRGEILYVSSQEGKGYFVKTAFGKIANASHDSFSGYKEKIDFYENLALQKNKRRKTIRYAINKNVTRKLLDPHSSLSKKYKKALEGRVSLNAQLSTFKHEAIPNFTEFREAYMNYAKNTLQYRLAKGKEIFYQMKKMDKTIEKPAENEYGDK